MQRDSDQGLPGVTGKPRAPVGCELRAAVPSSVAHRQVTDLKPHSLQAAHSHSAIACMTTSEPHVSPATLFARLKILVSHRTSAPARFRKAETKKQPVSPQTRGHQSQLPFTQQKGPYFFQLPRGLLCS